jgi:hypothetical protein
MLPVPHTVELLPFGTFLHFVALDSAEKVCVLTLRRELRTAGASLSVKCSLTRVDSSPRRHRNRALNLTRRTHAQYIDRNANGCRQRQRLRR